MTTHVWWPLVALAWLGFTSLAVADTPARPASYKQVSADGRFVFVMLNPFPADADNDELRQTYSKSGLYKNDGSADPLWAVDWYCDQVEVASDGVHLVRHGPWPSLSKQPSGPVGPTELGQEAVSFFANGKLLRTYSIGELVSDPDRLPRSWSHFRWRESGSLNDVSLEYTLTTKDGNTFVFDLTTGATVSAHRPFSPPAWVWVTLGVGAVVAVAAAVAWITVALWRMQKPKPRTTTPSDRPT